MKQKNIDSAKAVQMLDGVTRRTLSYNQQAMLCHIEIKKGSTIPLHHHVPVQIGMCLSGQLRFFGETDQDGFGVGSGDSYVMESNKPHGCEALEDSTVVEVFTPSREEYADF